MFESLIAHLVSPASLAPACLNSPFFHPPLKRREFPLVLTVRFGYLYATLSTAGELPRAVGRSKAIEKTFNPSGKGHGWPACTPLRARTADLG